VNPYSIVKGQWIACAIRWTKSLLRPRPIATPETRICDSLRRFTPTIIVHRRQTFQYSIADIL
jgi:hypothetical protein